MARVLANKLRNPGAAQLVCRRWSVQIAMCRKALRVFPLMQTEHLFEGWERRFPSVRELHLLQGRPVKGFQPWWAPPVFAGLCHLRGQLEALRIERGDFIEEESDFYRLPVPSEALVHLGALTRPQSLSLVGCRLADGGGGLSTLLSLARLEAVDLSHCKELKDQAIRAARAFTSLIKLSLARCTELTDRAEPGRDGMAARQPDRPGS